MPVVISSLYLYPIKSCTGIAVDSLSLDILGAANDRRYMLVDENGNFITQRQHAELIHVDVAIHVMGWMITLPNVGAKILPLQGIVLKIMTVNVWSDTFSAYDQGDDWAGFFSQFLGKKVRLVFCHLNTARKIDSEYCKTERAVSFADGFPLLMCNENSLQALNNELESPIDMQRFRPNIVITGASAFAEIEWETLDAGNLELAVVKPCSRCVIPTINPQTAKKEPAVWQGLIKLCKGEDGKVYFGQNLIHQANGILKLGDELLAS